MPFSAVIFNLNFTKTSKLHFLQNFAQESCLPRSHCPTYWRTLSIIRSWSTYFFFFFDLPSCHCDPWWRFLVAVFCGMIARQMRSEMCDWIPSHSFKISFSGTSSFWSTPFHKITSAEYLKTTLEELSERTSTRMQHRYNFLQSEIKVSKYYNLNNADDSSSKHSL